MPPGAVRIQAGREPGEDDGEVEVLPGGAAGGLCFRTANLRTKILDFRGFDSGRILILRGGILMYDWEFPGDPCGQRALFSYVSV